MPCSAIATWAGGPAWCPGQGERAYRAFVHSVRIFITEAAGGPRSATEQASRCLLLRTGRPAIGDWRSRWIGAEGDLHRGGFAQRGICTAGDLRSGPGLLEAFYPAAGGGTALEAAISQWSFAALALSPCIKKFVA